MYEIAGARAGAGAASLMVREIPPEWDEGEGREDQGEHDEGEGCEDLGEREESEGCEDQRELDETEAIGERIRIRAALLNVEEQALLVDIAEFDRRGGWKPSGSKDCAQWLERTTGMSRVTARERVRVARALEKLPQASAAMSRGELSFSAMRALARVADDLAKSGDDAEAELLGYAQKVTAAQLERLVRGWKQLIAKDEAELERERFRRRSFAVVPDGEGMYAVRGTLTPEVAAVLMAAIDAASDMLYRSDRQWAAEGGPRGPRVEEISAAQRRADAVGLIAEQAMAMGFRTEANGGDSVAEAGGESVGEVAEVADSDSAESRSDLQSQGDRSSAPPHPHPHPIVGTHAERYQVLLHVDEEALRADGGMGESFLHDGTRISKETARRLCCDASIVKVTRGPDGSVLDVGRKTRQIPPAIARALQVRDGGCRFPGCGLAYTTHHHIVLWIDGGETKLENLVLLCRYHHRCVHEDGFEVEYMGGNRFQFRDRTGWPLPDVLPAPTCDPDPLQLAIQEHLAKTKEGPAMLPSPATGARREGGAKGGQRNIMVK